MREHIFLPSSLWPEYWLEIYHEQYLVLAGHISPEEVKDREWAQIFDLEGKIKGALLGWRFCVSRKGYMGMVPAHSQKGDRVCVLFGADVPLVLRQASDTSHRLTLIGTAYINGIMRGEVIAKLNEGEVIQQTFSLI